MADEQQGWKIAGLAILPIRFVQGWIFWGGGSRRFIYDPAKLDPYAHSWMANKLQSAMPGAILGVGHLISFILQHFALLYVSILIFSLVELVSGLGLIVGSLTRFCGFTTMLISIVLMLAFGWQGATCMDEWTMAVATFAMGFALALSGASIYSIDHLLIKKYPALNTNKWFVLFGSGIPKNLSSFKKIALIFLTFTVVFTLFTYNYYRGSILTPYHLGPVIASKHHFKLSDGEIKPNGFITFTLYVDEGTPALPSNIIRIELLTSANHIAADWDGGALSSLPKDNIKNDYSYNRVTTGEYGLVAPLSAKASITLAVKSAPTLNKDKQYHLVLFTINGERFEMSLKKS